MHTLKLPGNSHRDLRQLLWHRHRIVQMRTRIMNQLQALAMNEGQRRKKKRWNKQGRAQLEKPPLAPWASRRRKDLLELLDRMNPPIEESVSVETFYETYFPSSKYKSDPYVVSIRKYKGDDRLRSNLDRMQQISSGKMPLAWISLVCALKDVAARASRCR